MKKLYLVARTELPRELPAEIIRGFTSEGKAIEFFMDLTNAPISVVTDAIDSGELGNESTTAGRYGLLWYNTDRTE